MEELGCLGIWEDSRDYILCEWNWDLLPKLFKQDTLIYEYNQNTWTWSSVSCTIFAAIWMASDLWNYKFSESEIHEIDELSYQRGRIRGQWWYVQSAVKLVCNRWNENKELVKKYWKMAYYRISKYNTELIEDAIGKLYTIDWNLCPTAEFTADYKRDWMVDGTNFWYNTNWHSVDVISYEWQRSVKDSYVGRKYNIYWLKNNLSDITNIWSYFYIYTKVKEDALEDIKRLNEMKTVLLRMIEDNSAMWHMTNDENYRVKLHDMNNRNREKLNDIDNELKKYM